ncbi:MAG: glutamate--tRNA ligase [Candidatus Omnitrophica bacterium]|nr:glutamate--tRNA ligase [Candidatus Omnitrophota bacterium]
MEPSVRVRFAPSPTGYLHIGGVRTALFNFLYARSQGGKFLLRMEDSDRARSEKKYETEILESLKWLGLAWDEPFFYQSARLEIYQKAARELLAKGLAYEEKGEGGIAIKFKIPPRKIGFTDLVHGEVQFDTSLFGDLVLIKSDGFPTYHWACVLDDHEMRISHVIRGDDHLSNTPRQQLLFEVLGWKAPKYAHLPLILGGDGTPLSKRHGAVSLASFREQGFVPEGMINYLALLGWGVEGNQEFYTFEELIKKFSIKRITKTNARFDYEKLSWMNGQHLKKLNESDYLARVSEFYADPTRKISPEKWKKTALLFRSRIRTLSELKEQACYIFEEPENYPSDIRNDFLQNKPLKRHLEAWIEEADKLPNFLQPEEIEKMTRETANGWGIEAKDIIHPLRFALTAKTVSPGLFELMSVLGKEACLSRVKKLLGRS